MKTYIVYLNGVESGYVKAGNLNSAEKKVKKKHPDKDIQVVYTEL